MTLTPEQSRLKMLRMRSWRRGMKEMDLILGPFADAHLDTLSGPELDEYDKVLSENDQDLYLWVTGAQDAPEWSQPMLRKIAQAAGVTKTQ